MSASNCVKKTWPGPDSCSVDKATKGKEMRNKVPQTPVRTILPIRPEPTVCPHSSPGQQRRCLLVTSTQAVCLCSLLIYVALVVTPKYERSTLGSPF